MDKSIKSISEAYLSMFEATKVEAEDEKETDVDTEKKSKESDAAKDDPAADKPVDDKKKDDEEVEESSCGSKKKMKENLNFMIPKGKAASAYMSRKAKMRQDQHKEQDPKHAKTHAKNMVDMDKAEKKAKKKGVTMRDYGRDNWKVRNGVKRGKLPEQFEAMMAESVELNESSTRDYVDTIMPRSLKKAGLDVKVTKKTGYTSYKVGDYEIVNDGVGIKVKENGKEIAYYSKPKLDYKKAVEKVNEDVEQLEEFMKFDAKDAIKDFSGKVAKIASAQKVTAKVMPVRGNSFDTDNGYVPVLKNFTRKGKTATVDLKAGDEVAIDTKRGNVYGMVGDKFFYTSTGNVDLKEGVELEEAKFSKGDSVKIKNVKKYDALAKDDKGTVIGMMSGKVMVKVGSGQMNVDPKDLIRESVEIAEAKEHPAYQQMMDLAKKLNDRDTRAIQVLAGKIANFTATGNRGNMKDMAKALKSLDTKNQAAVVKILNKTDSALGRSIVTKMAGMKEEVVQEASGDKEAYQKFFQSALKKFGVKSPAELDGDKEKEFYDYVDKNWEGDNEVEESVQLDELAKFTDKQIKMAYGIINDKRWKGGNMTHIVKTIEKIAKGLSKHPGVEKALKATNESALDSIKSKLKGE